MFGINNVLLNISLIMVACCPFSSANASKHNKELENTPELGRFVFEGDAYYEEKQINSKSKYTISYGHSITVDLNNMEVVDSPLKYGIKKYCSKKEDWYCIDGGAISFAINKKWKQVPPEWEYNNQVYYVANYSNKARKHEIVCKVAKVDVPSSYCVRYSKKSGLDMILVQRDGGVIDVYTAISPMFLE